MESVVATVMLLPFEPGVVRMWTCWGVYVDRTGYQRVCVYCDLTTYYSG